MIVTQSLVYDAIQKDAFADDLVLCNQIQAAAGSVMHNYDKATQTKKQINAFVAFVGYLTRGKS